MIEPLVRAYTIRRGDYWVGETFNLRSAAGVAYWGSPEVDSQIKAEPGGEVLHEFTITPVVTNDAGVGVLSFVLDMNEEASGALPIGITYGDVQVRSDGQPTATFITYTINNLADITS